MISSWAFLACLSLYDLLSWRPRDEDIFLRTFKQNYKLYSFFCVCGPGAVIDWEVGVRVAYGIVNRGWGDKKWEGLYPFFYKKLEFQ